MASQRHVKRISGADQEVKPNQEVSPAPQQVSQNEATNNQHHVEWKEIRRQGDDKVVLRDYHMPAVGSDFEFLYLSAERKRGQGMGQFVAEHVEAHRLGEKKEYHQPAGCAAPEGDPNGVRLAGLGQHAAQSAD